MRLGSRRERTSVIFPCLGRIEWRESALFSFMQATEGLREQFEWVLALDGPAWSTLPYVQYLTSQAHSVKVVASNEPSDHPGVLYNLGFRSAAGDRVIFIDPNYQWDAQAAATLDTSSSSAPARLVLCEAMREAGGFPHMATADTVYPWLLMSPMLPLSFCSLSSEAAEDLGPFDESEFLAELSSEDFLIRLLRSTEFSIEGYERSKLAPSHLGLTQHGILHRRRTGRDLSRRYAVRKFDQSAAARSAAMVRDLPGSPGPDLAPAGADCRALDDASGKPLKITIFTGPFDYHHNWLCFYNYFEYLEGTGFGTHRTVMDSVATPTDVAGCDLVILSRARSDNVRQILDWAQAFRVPVLYMIDDNWLHVAADWPKQYGELFGPDSPSLKNFTEALRRSSAVLTYNPILAADISPYSQAIYTLPNSVDIERFEQAPRPSSPVRFTVGYAGSPRFTTPPFQALAAIARAREDVRCVVFGSLLPEHEKLFDGAPIVRRPFMPYHRYISELRSLSVDVMIAPAEGSRTSRSKCPNKFLEITAMGAVGIYSAVEPYTWHIKDGMNGSLVPEDGTVADWTAAIDGALDRPTVERQFHAAVKAVKRDHNARLVAKEFEKLVRRLVGWSA